MTKVTHYQNNRERRHLRIRKRVIGTAGRPRLAVFRSNYHIYAQIIDDALGKTLAAASDFDLETRGASASVAEKVGEKLAEKARQAGVTAVTFDRGGYQYHGRVASLADGARKGGLLF